MSERPGTERSHIASGGDDPEVPTAPAEPLATNDRATVLVGCVVWAVLLALGLLNRSTLEAEGLGWWVWTCVAGLALGVVGLAWLQVRHRRLVASGCVPSKLPTG